jgi:hypothetical protein
MLVKKSINLNCTFEQAVSAVKKSSLLFYVSYPVIFFTPSSAPIPIDWVEGRYWVRLKLFGFIPLGRQAIVISFDGEGSKFIMKDNGHSFLISQWDHTITIERVSEKETRYEDHVEVQAGILTPIVWLFANYFYHHRQKRWLNLCSTDFQSIL